MQSSYKKAQAASSHPTGRPHAVLPVGINSRALAIAVYHSSKTRGNTMKVKYAYVGGMTCSDEDEISGNMERSLSSIQHFLEYFISRLTRKYNNGPSHYVQMPSWDMENIYKNYPKVIQFLLKLGIVEVYKGKEGKTKKGRYISKKVSKLKKGLCKSYRLTEAPTEITHKPCHDTILSKIVDKLDSQQYKADKSKVKDAVMEYQFQLLKNDIVIEMNGWQDWNLEISTFYSVRRQLNRLKQGIVNVTSEGITTRVYSIMTTMPKEARQFVKYKDGRSFGHVDISSAHAYFLSTLINEPDEAIKNGEDVYQLLADEMGITRDEFKQRKLMNFSMYGKWAMKGKVLKAFQKVLPRFTKHLCDLDKGKTQEEREAIRTELSHIMLDTEADFVVRTVGEVLMKENVPFYTVHDCIYVVSGFENRVEDVMKEKGTEYFGYEPRFKTVVGA